MGLHRYLDLSRRVDELAVATRENARLDQLLSQRVSELEQVTVRLAETRLARRAKAPDDQ